MWSYFRLAAFAILGALFTAYVPVVSADRPSIRAAARPAAAVADLHSAASRTSRQITQSESEGNVVGNNVVRATLTNGLRVVIVPDNLSPVATTVVNYLVGSNEAPPGFPGLAHAEEHMMFRGSPDLSADQLASIAAAMGGNFDADTQQTVTQYFFTVPAEDADVALHIEALRMRGVLNTDKLWDKERGAIEQEVAQDLSNPQYVFYTKLLAAMFKGTPYEHDALGTRPSFDKTTGAMLHEFYEKWYAPNNAVMIVAGDVDPQKTLAEVKSLFGDIPRKAIPPRPAVSLSPVSAEALHLPTDLPYGLAVMSYRTPGFDSADFAALNVLSDVLSSQRGTLYALVPQGKALYADFELSPLPRGGVAYALGVFPKGGDGEGLIGEMKQIIADDLKNGVPADLVDASKRREVASEEFQKNSIEGLAMEWSSALAIEGRQSPDDDIRDIQKVTVDDVNRVAKKYLAPDEAVTAILTPQSSGNPISSKGFGGAEALAGSPTGPVTLPSWAQNAVTRLTIPDWTIHPVVSTLPNGIKLIVQPEKISNSVTVVGHIKSNSDLETPKGREGVGSILNDLFSYGTQTLDRIAFRKALDDLAADESAGTDFSLSVLAPNFDKGVELLAENELHPALPGQAFTIVQQQTAQVVAGELQSPDYLTRRAFDKSLLPKDDPELRQATPQSVSAVTLDDVRGYLQHVYRPDLTTIAVIGNISPDEAKAVVEKYFGAWASSGPPPQTDLPSVPPNQPGVTAVPDKSRVQVIVNLGETLQLNRFNPDYYALELGNHVLGGGFYATRLYRDLRENGGLVYYVGSSFQIGKTRSSYKVDYACDPQNVSKARAVVVRDLNAMQKAPVTADELRQARAMLLRQIPLSQASETSIASGLVSRAVIGLPLDEPIVAAHHYVELTAAQVQAAFAKWLRPVDLVQVTEGPAPQ
ncbi:MAG TPA: pitrilysin family protein [Candidatus Acidoferrales bacterium]|nr:pitrilysin family protein [Candidatus Acidoferrales bacterium]